MLLKTVKWLALISKSYDITNSVNWFTTLKIQWNAKLLNICAGDHYLKKESYDT